MENGSASGVYLTGQKEWEKMIKKKTVLIVGLFFSVLLLAIFGCMKMEQKLKVDTQIKIGMLLEKYPELESDIVESFLVDKKDLSMEEKEHLRSIGESLLKKYGFDKTQYLKKSVKSLGTGFVSFIVMLFALVLFCVWWASKKEYKKLYTGLEDILDYVEQYLKGNYDYTRIRNKNEGDFVDDICNRTEELGSVISCFMGNMEREKERIKELVTDISHQLKTPLASLKMSYEIMTSSEFTEEEQKEFLNHGKDEIEKLQILLSSLIKVSRLEANMIEIIPVKAKIKETIIRAVETVYMKADEKSIMIEMEEFKEMELYFDPKWTQEVFINILDNAVKYSSPDTSIIIRVSEMISFILIEIEDEGIGIERKEYSKIFQRFYRGNKKEVIEQEGSGVGLYLARKILEEQGGTIRVKKGAKKGSIFSMTLPKQ